MNQQFLKEKKMGSKNALVKKRIITHYIYIMVVPLFPIFQKN
ncbi:xylose repressor [Bacteroides thetaiotaomicron]|nr:xylose repressor [Bacteroides thetaiotaomicron]